MLPLFECRTRFSVIYSVHLCCGISELALSNVCLRCDTDKEEAINIQSLMKSVPKFCRHCDVVVLNSGIRMRKSQLPYLSPDEKV